MTGSVEPSFGDERDTIRDRAKAAGIQYVYADYAVPTRPCLLLLFFSDGDVSRSVVIDEDSAARFNALNFEKFQVVGPYRSLHDASDNSLEAAIVPNPANRYSSLTKTLMRLPGAERIESDATGVATVSPIEIHEADSSVPDLEEERLLRTPIETWNLPSWRLPFVGARHGLAVELSPPSIKFKAFSGVVGPGSPVTMKIQGLAPVPQEEIINQLETVAGSVLFELDVRFNVGLSLQHTQATIPGAKRVDRDRNRQPVMFPTVRYPRAATTLYRYGRSAVENPLLQYLAYYQAIEHFFSSFVERESINRVRYALRHPAFNRESDADIRRVIVQAGRGQRNGPRESDQLRTTLAHCIEPGEVEAWLETTDDTAKAFLLGSKQIAGVRPLSLRTEHQKSVIDQIADRVYTLRCRIVHAKDSDSFVEPLLPYSAEARNLRADLLLIEFLCQRVIIAGSNETF